MRISKEGWTLSLETIDGKKEYLLSHKILLSYLRLQTKGITFRIGEVTK